MFSSLQTGTILWMLSRYENLFTTLPGDGIGPEVIGRLKVLDALGSMHGWPRKHDPRRRIGIDNHGKPCLPHPVACEQADAILFARSADRSGKPSTQATARTSRPPPLAQAFELRDLRPATSIPNWPALSPLAHKPWQRNRRSLRSRTYRRVISANPSELRPQITGTWVIDAVYRSGEIERIIEIAARAASPQG